MTQHDDLDAPDALLTPSEVAALFRVNPKTVTRWARSGKLTAIRTLGGPPPLQGVGDPPLPRGDVARARARRRALTHQSPSTPHDRSPRRPTTSGAVRVFARARARVPSASPRSRARTPAHGHPHRRVLHPPPRPPRQPPGHPRPAGHRHRRRRRQHHRHRRLRRPGRPPRRGRARQLLARRTHIERVTAAVRGVDGVEVLEVADRTFEMHEGGKIEVLARMPIADRDDLSMAYTPGVARVCTAIAAAARRWPTSSPSRRTPSPSSPTAPRCSAWATSARPAPCR